MNELLKLKNEVKQKLQQLINLKYESVNLMQRGNADKLETIIFQKIYELNSSSVKILEASSKRSIEDLNIYYKAYNIYVDVKSHDINGIFCMPNLISIKRLKKLLANDNNHLWYVFVDYEIVVNNTIIKNINVSMIEEIPWKYLAIQNIGNGQLQIKNNNIYMDFVYTSRENWVEELNKHAYEFYNKQIKKFEKLKQEWL